MSETKKKKEQIPLAQVKKLPFITLQRLINKMRAFLKQDATVQKMFKDHGINIGEIDYIPICFGDIDVSATTNHGVITLNYKLLTDGDFFKDFSYGTHEITHWLDQCCGNKPTKSSNTGNYLDNEFEQSAFQNQIEFIADNFGEGEAEKYVDHLLDHHEVEKKDEREEKKEVLMSKV